MRQRALMVVLAMAAFLGAMPSAVQAAGPRPAWSIIAVPYPSAFAPGSAFGSAEGGPGYQLQAFNVGGAGTAGEFTITDTLPGALRPSTTFAPFGLYGQENGEENTAKLSCTAVGQTITCTGGSAAPVEPGAAASVVVPVEVVGNGTALNRARIEGGGAERAATTTTPTPITAVPSPFGFIAGAPGLFGSADAADGTPETLAGAHPYQATVAAMTLATKAGQPGSTGVLAVGGGPRDITVELPRGEVINPQATPQCTERELTHSEAGCPDDTQVGTVALTLSIARGIGFGPSIHALYNMVAPPGHPAELGFEVIEGTYVHLLGHVSSDGAYTLSASSDDILAKEPIAGVRAVLWGDPTSEGHDTQRGECLLQEGTRLRSRCPVVHTGKAFVTMPAACSGPLTTQVAATSWLGDAVSGSYSAPEAIVGCEGLAFEPSIESRVTTTKGESPSGLDFHLRQAQHEDFAERATAPLDDTSVTLPEGLVLNPSAAGGRQACSSSQIGLATAPAQTPIRFREEAPHCPESSKLGTVSVDTPLLGHELAGAVYLAKPFDNPFGSLLGIYLVVEDEESGILAKLAGKVEPDPATGRLTTIFVESPQLPFDDIHLHLFDGSRAALTTPLACGTKTTTARLIPWSGTPAVSSADSFDTTEGCSASEATAPKAVSFTAGTESPLSGAYSPFVLRIARPDGSQHITGVDTTLPQGLLGKLAGVAYCPESGIVQARSREAPEKGREELASPSCPAASEVGTVNVTAGSGPSPFLVSGHAYLAGPYKGAPLSLVVIVPAVAGPFDLGTVVDRVALDVGEYDARIHAAADPLPTIRDGIPLDVRSIELKLDRPSFILNPTSCEVMAIEGSVSTQAGQGAALGNRFQAAGCERLAFKPKVKISLKGGTKRTGHPALKAVVTYPKSGAYANIARAQVNLPHSEFLDQGNFNKTCTRPVLQEGRCPASSIYGRAKAWTPLLEKPLEGNVYLVGGYGYKLPALVAELNGQVRFLLVGKVDTGKNNGIRNTFEAVPDAPVEKFVLEMKGGKKYGLLENSEDICRRAQKAAAVFRAQNGRRKSFSVKIANSCGKGKKEGGKKKAQ